MSEGTWDPWTFRSSSETPLAPENLIGFTVHATDGAIGKVDDAASDEEASRIVVDTHPWLPGGHVVLPVGTVERVDLDNSDVYVDLTKDQIRDAPSPSQMDERTPGTEASYRDRAAPYFGALYSTRRL